MSHMTTDVASLAAGVLGGGFMAEVHSRAVRAARGTLAAVTSSSASSTREAAARLGAGRPFTSPDELVADDGVDVVHVCTPNATHRELALAALRAGKHVVCEMPLELSFLRKWKETGVTALGPVYSNFQWRTPLLAVQKIFAGEEVPSEWVLPQVPIAVDELDDYLARNEGMPDGHYAKFGGEDLPGYPEVWQERVMP